MGTHDSQQLKSEADFLARSSRPQRNSKWVPKTRDWRYATGVIQHDDHDDAPKARSTWDILDHDYQSRGKQKSPKRLSRSRSGTASEPDVLESTEPAHAPEPAVLMAAADSPDPAAQLKGPQKPTEFRRRVWRQVKKYTRRDPSGSGEDIGDFDVTGLVVRMRFTRKNKALLQETLSRTVPSAPTSIPVALTKLPAANPKPTPPISSPGTPAVARTAETVRTHHILDSIESLYSFPLFKRAWVDETYDFNFKSVLATLRSGDKIVDDLGGNYEWYDYAPRADAIFPPGVPLSAKEIHAFYPHHVRWKTVMVRLTSNDYRGPDILGMQAYFRGAPNHHTPPAAVNNYQRDTVKTALPGFKTATYKGKSDRNLRMDHHKPGIHIESMRKGSTLPTFEDLVRGLNRIPSGLDARGFTQCISWYLNIRDSFTPKLELNVLHTQSLIRALREPLKPFGPQNLDRNALQEWREKGTFETTPIEHKEQQDADGTVSNARHCRTQLQLDLDKDAVSMNLTLPIRHILTFPFLALHGVMSDALRMGIEKAEIRKAARKESEVKNALKKEPVAESTNETSNEALPEEHEDNAKNDQPSIHPPPKQPKKPYRIPKRVRPSQEDQLPVPKRPYNSSPSTAFPSYRPLAPAPPRDPALLARSWDSRAPSSAYQPPRQAQDSVHGRRDLADRQRDTRGEGGAGRERERNERVGPQYGLGQHGDVYRPSR